MRFYVSVIRQKAILGNKAPTQTSMHTVLDHAQLHTALVQCCSRTMTTSKVAKIDAGHYLNQVLVQLSVDLLSQLLAGAVHLPIVVQSRQSQVVDVDPDLATPVGRIVRGVELLVYAAGRGQGPEQWASTYQRLSCQTAGACVHINVVATQKPRRCKGNSKHG